MTGYHRIGIRDWLQALAELVTYKRAIRRLDRADKAAARRHATTLAGPHDGCDLCAHIDRTIAAENAAIVEAAETITREADR